jgi:hypothetical protein
MDIIPRPGWYSHNCVIVNPIQVIPYSESFRAPAIKIVEIKGGGKRGFVCSQVSFSCEASPFSRNTRGCATNTTARKRGQKTVQDSLIGWRGVILARRNVFWKRA